MMKKIILLLVTVFLMGGMAMAQQARRGDKMPDPKARAERMTERMVKEYSLNDTQKQQLQEANLVLMERMGDMRRPEAEKKRGESEKKRGEMETARTTYDAQLQKIMTKDQYAAYTKDMKDRQEKMKSGRKAPRRK